MVCSPVQICWHKFARYWDIELREIPMEHDRLLMTPEEVLKRCDENSVRRYSSLSYISNHRKVRIERHALAS